MSNENSNLRASAPHPDFEYLRTFGREDGYTLEITARVVAQLVGFGPGRLKRLSRST